MKISQFCTLYTSQNIFKTDRGFRENHANNKIPKAILDEYTRKNGKVKVTSQIMWMIDFRWFLKDDLDWLEVFELNEVFQKLRFKGNWQHLRHLTEFIHIWPRTSSLKHYFLYKSSITDFTGSHKNKLGQLFESYSSEIFRSFTFLSSRVSLTERKQSFGQKMHPLLLQTEDPTCKWIRKETRGCLVSFRKLAKADMLKEW